MPNHPRAQNPLPDGSSFLLGSPGTSKQSQGSGAESIGRAGTDTAQQSSNSASIPDPPVSFCAASVKALWKT